MREMTEATSAIAEQQAALWTTVLERLQTATGIAYDGCHKIYITMDDGQLEVMHREGWGTDNDDSILLSNTQQERTPKELLHIVQTWFEGSCSLQFVNAVSTIDNDPGNADFEQLIEQFNAAFSEDAEDEDEALLVIEDAIPEGFWKQIDHQLDRIADKGPDTFDKVREILLDPQYTDIQAEIHRNGVRNFDDNNAFFAGSGGDRTIFGSLYTAGWNPLIQLAPYHYTLRHGITGEELSYIEGDLERGNKIQGPLT